MTHASPNIDRRKLHSVGDDYDLHADLGSFAGEPKTGRVFLPSGWNGHRSSGPRGTWPRGNGPLALRENGIPEDDGHRQIGVTTNATEYDRGGIKAVTGHTDVHSLHRHLFGDMAPRIEGHYTVDYDGGSVPPIHFAVSVLNDAGTNAIGDIERHFRGGLQGEDGTTPPRTMHNALLDLQGNQQGKGIARRLYGAQEQYARDTGTKQITLHADISTGPYAWAKQGFDFSPDQSHSDNARALFEKGMTPLDHYKNALSHEVTTQGEDGYLNPREVGAHLSAIEGLKHSWDVANFDTGVHVPLATMDGAPGHLGKYVMTQKPHRLDYIGYKDITPDASSEGERQAATVARPAPATALPGPAVAFHPDALGEPPKASRETATLGEYSEDAGDVAVSRIQAGADNLETNPHAKLIAHIARKDWYHVPPSDPHAYQKRGKFLASSYDAAAFYGRPNDEPEKVSVKNPLVGDEHHIEQHLFGYHPSASLPEPGTRAFYPARTGLDAKIKTAAIKKGYDSIALMTPSAHAAYQETQKIPRSIELNVLHPGKPLGPGNRPPD